ncbi:hypothetical protein K469DRAFT_744609 [Zopfia rhizophila CBS 207.26]|uniref:Uncharacterized protein n=1 Tax=Zopfia rhizophila CBS 207.26 TaxID=1314779 RepID=A0A6A6EVK3_9PEZI|nr:hypothetical protein K469DRAFT_744609 [Zopfia rhizophila CBS 207.26]
MSDPRARSRNMDVTIYNYHTRRFPEDESDGEIEEIDMEYYTKPSNSDRAHEADDSYFRSDRRQTHPQPRRTWPNDGLYEEHPGYGRTNSRGYHRVPQGAHEYPEHQEYYGTQPRYQQERHPRMRRSEIQRVYFNGARDMAYFAVDTFARERRREIRAETRREMDNIGDRMRKVSVESDWLRKKKEEERKWDEERAAKTRRGGGLKRSRGLDFDMDGSD